MRRYATTITLMIVLWVGLGGANSPAAALSDGLKNDLATSKYVYIASTRKDGSFSKPAEIWYMYHNDAVYVGTPPTSWRAKRIKAGRPQAKIWVGKPDGPSFLADGAIVNDPKAVETMMETFAKKYPDGWQTHAEKFRTGFTNGSRVLIKYTPKGS